MQRAGHVVLTAAVRGDRVVDVGSDALEAVDVSARTRRTARQLAQIVVVTTRDAVERQRAMARGAYRPASAALLGIDSDEHVLTLRAGARLTADKTAPCAGERSSVGRPTNRGERRRGEDCRDGKRENPA